MLTGVPLRCIRLVYWPKKQPDVLEARARPFTIYCRATSVRVVPKQQLIFDDPGRWFWQTFAPKTTARQVLKSQRSGPYAGCRRGRMMFCRLDQCLALRRLNRVEGQKDGGGDVISMPRKFVSKTGRGSLNFCGRVPLSGMPSGHDRQLERSCVGCSPHLTADSYTLGN